MGLTPQAALITNEKTAFFAGDKTVPADLGSLRKIPVRVAKEKEAVETEGGEKETHAEAQTEMRDVGEKADGEIREENARDVGNETDAVGADKKNETEEAFEKRKVGPEKGS